MKSLLRRPELIDGVLLFLLSMIALIGFHDVFIGWAFLAAGAAGLVLGIALAFIAARIHQPAIVLAVFVVAAFFVFGGPIALAGLGGRYLLPMPTTLAQLADVGVHGWKQLVTTLPPINDGPLLAIPYMIGLVAGSTGASIAWRVRSAGAPLLVPVSVLALVISLGVKNPTRATAVAGAFAALAIAWALVRNRRRQLKVTTTGARRTTRRVTAAALCLGATALATVVGPHWPGRQPHREIIRTQVIPPLNVEQYSSPLVGFRRFTSGYKLTDPQDELYDKPLFQVSGLPVGTTIRLATLDSYDGDVWGAGNVAGTDVPTPNDPATFHKVGHVIGDQGSGTSVAASVRIEDSSALKVWVPIAGKLTGLDFHGDRSCGDHAYYNLTSATAVQTDGLARCNSYSFRAVLPSSAFSTQTILAAGSLPGVTGATQFQQTAAGIAGKSTDPAATIKALTDYLKGNGHKTDGEGDFSQYAAGHSLYRLQLFMSTAGQLAGDEEQFSAMLALLANGLNIPARVVVGVQSLPAGDTVTIHGSDISAWVEVQAQDGSWKDIPASMFTPSQPPQPQNPQPQTNQPAANIPPPAPVHPPATAGQPFNDTLSHRTTITTHSKHGFGPIITILEYVVLPLAIIALIVGAIIGLKTLRRRRRRTYGPPSRRLVGAWNELLDHARDYGLRAPIKATRHEQAIALGVAQASESALRVDNTMFGREAPSSDEVEALWNHIDLVRREISHSRGRWARIRATVSVVTLRPRGLLRT